jgi:hypothetical protein
MGFIYREIDISRFGGPATMTEKVMVCGTCLVTEDSADVRTRYSLGIYAGHYCPDCWAKSGMRKEGREGFDSMDAGESYDPDY